MFRDRILPVKPTRPDVPPRTTRNRNPNRTLEIGTSSQV